MPRSGILWLVSGLSVVVFLAWFMVRFTGSDSAKSWPESSADEPRALRAVDVTHEAPTWQRSLVEMDISDEREGDPEDDASGRERALPVDVAVFGRVQDWSGVPINGAELELAQLLDGERPGASVELRSSEDGSFRTTARIARWDDRDEASFLLRAWAPGFQPNEKFEEVSRDEPELEFRIQLERGGIVSGRVVDVRGAPVADAGVVLVRDGIESDSAETGEDGTYLLFFADAGACLLHARAAQAGVAGPMAANLRTDRRNEVPDLVLEGGGEIAGVLVDSFGAPIAHQELTAMGEAWAAKRGWSIEQMESSSPYFLDGFAQFEADGLIYSQTETETNGTFRFTALAPGRFAIISYHDGKKVWVQRTGQTDLRLVQEHYELRVEVRDSENPRRRLSGDLYLMRTGSEEPRPRRLTLDGWETRIVVSPGVEYVVAVDVRDTESTILPGLLDVGPPPRQVDHAEQRVWIDPADSDPSIRFVVELKPSGTLEIRLVPDRFRINVDGQIESGHRGMRRTPFWIEALPGLAQPVQRMQLLPGRYVVSLRVELDSEIWSWLRGLANPPPSSLPLPQHWRLGVPDRPRHSVEVVSGEEPTVLEVDLVKAGAALLLLGCEEDSVPELTGSTLISPQERDESEVTDRFAIGWNEGRPVSGHVIDRSLRPGKYVWRGSAEGFQDLEVEFWIAPEELTVVRETWRR